VRALRGRLAGQTHAVRTDAASTSVEQEAVLVSGATSAKAELLIAKGGFGRTLLVGRAGRGAGSQLSLAVVFAGRIVAARQCFARGRDAIGRRYLRRGHRPCASPLGIVGGGRP